MNVHVIVSIILAISLALSLSRIVEPQGKDSHPCSKDSEPGAEDCKGKGKEGEPWVDYIPFSIQK